MEPSKSSVLTYLIFELIRCSKIIAGVSGLLVNIITTIRSPMI